MFVSAVASSEVFAHRGHGHNGDRHNGNDNGKSSSIHQVITLANVANQRSNVQTSGSHSDIEDSGNMSFTIQP